MCEIISKSISTDEKMIYLCKHFTDRYHLKIFIIFALIYHIYIECELYNLAYLKIFLFSCIWKTSKRGGLFGRCHGFKVCTVACYIDGYIEDDKPKGD